MNRTKTVQFFPPNEDSEIGALRLIVEALEPMGMRARARILRWATDRYFPEVAPPGGSR